MPATKSLNVTRTSISLRPDQSRVLLRPFTPGDVPRAGRIVARILSLPESRMRPLLDEVLAEFSGRHQNVADVFLDRFERVRHQLSLDGMFSEPRKLLIGSYFVSEYSLESAALFNPSIVPHPDQSGVPADGLRFVLSLRATGEGHISSITFRTGMIHPDHRIEVMPPAGYLTEPHQVRNPLYDKELFERKLCELGLTDEFTRGTLNRLGQSFTPTELRRQIREELKQDGAAMAERDRRRTAKAIWVLAESNYEVQFRPE